MDRGLLRGAGALVVFVACAGGTLPAQTVHGGTAEKVCQYESSHFFLSTDLPADEVPAALERMERTLEFAAEYWRLRCRGKIRCYLIHQQDHWRDSQLPHPLVRVTVGGVGGVTVGEARSAEREGRCQATIYASNAAGVLEHEVVHAYCIQTFGGAGPDWYKEGMAEVGAFRGDGAHHVQCPQERLRELREVPPKTIAQIVSAQPMTGGISDSLNTMFAARPADGAQVPLTQWTARDGDNVRQARRDYLWSWALCHLLIHNPNYASRFRSLGESLLTNRTHSFQRVFEPVARELEFEYRFFVDRAAVGYRVDLCAWDWGARFQRRERGESVQRRVLAARGYQPSGLTVSARQRYAFQAEGAWSTRPDGPLADANGVGGEGRLEGVVLSDFRLSTPFDLGVQGAFLAPDSGNLYLRCRDAWDQLGDNRGDVRVRLSPL